MCLETNFKFCYATFHLALCSKRKETFINKTVLKGDPSAFVLFEIE